jgi:hypothetical protein
MQIPAAYHPRKPSTLVTALFTFFVVAGTGLFFLPAFIIRPFRYQAPRALVAAMAVAQHAPLWTLIAAIASCGMALVLWNRVARHGKTAIVLGLIFVVGSATMSRIDYFEWMFHPIHAAGFTSAADSNLATSEMIMAVRVGNEARAYPIREMAYHHVLNDTVAGTPIVVTY